MERKILECSVILETDRFKNLEIQQKARNEYFRRMMKILKSKQNDGSDKLTLREKYPNMEFFLVHTFSYSVQILENTYQKNPVLGHFSHSVEHQTY